MSDFSEEVRVEVEGIELSCGWETVERESRRIRSAQRYSDRDLARVGLHRRARCQLQSVDSITMKFQFVPAYAIHLQLY